MPSLSEQDQLRLVNSLILDVGALEGRISEVLNQLTNSDDPDSQVRKWAVEIFKDAVLIATTRLRQEGLHLDVQGRLL